jgi:hypothetical protein
MEATPGALQLRLLQTIVEVAAEKNSTLVLPFPVELLRFLEKNTNVELPRSDSPERVSPDRDKPERDLTERDSSDSSM